MRGVLALIVILLGARGAVAQPSGGPASAPAAAPASAPASAPAAPPTAAPARGTPAQEIRFDALRIDGALHGPEALTIRSDLARQARPLHRLRRSFLRRILRTVESPCLHR